MTTMERLQAADPLEGRLPDAQPFPLDAVRADVVEVDGGPLPTTTPPRRRPRTGRLAVAGALACALAALVATLLALGGGEDGGRPVPAATNLVGPPRVTPTLCVGPGQPARPSIPRCLLATAADSKVNGTLLLEDRPGEPTIAATLRLGVLGDVGRGNLAVWLARPGEKRFLGFVDRKAGELTVVPFPMPRGYDRLLVTRETEKRPRRPGVVLLTGTL